MAARHAHKEHRKFPFIEAYVRLGTISAAAKRSRVSREQVHRWLKSDESFARAFSHAKRRRADDVFTVLDSALVFMSNIVQPIIDRSTWPRVAAALAIGVTNLKNDLKGGRRHVTVQTGEVAGFSRLPDVFEDVAIPNRSRENSANDL